MAAITVNVDDHTYENAKALFAFLGTDIESAVKQFIIHASYDEYPHYEHIRPNAETIAAIRECGDIISGRVSAKGHTDIDEMFREILAEKDDD